MAVALPPIDTSVQLPASVLKAAAAAEAIHKAAYPDAPPAPVAPPAPQPARLPPDPEQPIQLAAVSEPPAPAQVQPAAPEQVQPAPAQQPTPQPDPSQVQPPPQPDNWEHRYHSMKGRYDQSQQTMAGMQEQMREMGDELMRLTSMVNQRGRQEQTQRAQPAQQRVTDADVTTFGPEIIDLAKRAAADAISPELNAVRQENQQLKRTVNQQVATGIYADLDAAVANWREINTSPRFLQWLRLPDLYSGSVRGSLLKQAFAAADAPRVVRFFKGFLAEEQATGQLPAPSAVPAATAPRQAAVPLVNLAAPGVRPASDLNAPVDKPIFTHKQIAEFYSHQGRARYVGRDEDRRNDEQMIFEAQREGRIR
jgi:hypothetical protein